MSLLFAVDPGPTESALVVLERDPLVPGWVIVGHHFQSPNAQILGCLASAPFGAGLVIEQIASFGMPVGAEVFETVFWSGRFYETWPNSNRFRLPRSAVKLHLCGSMRAKDANIRQALIDRFGGSSAIGRAKSKGPLYGIKGDCWQALAVGVTWLDQHPPTHQEPSNAVVGAI